MPSRAAQHGLSNVCAASFDNLQPTNAISVGITDGSRRRPYDYRRQNRNRFISGDNQNRTTLILGFGPPDLALLRHIHPASSEVIRAVAASAHPISSSVCGICTKPSGIHRTIPDA